MEYDVGLNIIEVGSNYIKLYAEGGFNGDKLFPFPWFLKYSDETTIAILNTYGEYTVTGLQPNTTYTFYLRDGNGNKFGEISATTASGSGGGGTVDPSPDPGGSGGGGVIAASWAIGAYTLTANSAIIQIINNSSSLQPITSVQLLLNNIPYASWSGNAYMSAGQIANFTLTVLISLSANTNYSVYINGNYIRTISYSNSLTKPALFSWKNSSILQGYFLNIAASDWILLQNKITEVYRYIKATNLPTWSPIVSKQTQITAAIYNEVAAAINGLWYGNINNQVIYATQKETKLSATIFNNLVIQLNKYIDMLT